MSFVIKLSEDGSVPARVQLLRVGSFNYEGEPMLITKEIMASFVKNFEAKVRGYEDGKLPIDYFHENDKVAAGWISSLVLENEGNELWAEVQWTPRGQKVIGEGELRYLSVEFHFDYESNEGGVRFGPTLFGAGLTNRPFIKGMKAIKTLSDKLAGQAEKGYYTMTPEQMVAKIAELEKAIAEMKSALEASKGQVEAAKQEAEGLKQEKAMSDKKASFDKMLAEGKAVEAQRESFMSGDMAKFAELAKPTNKDSRGAEGGEGEGKGDAQDQILKLAETIQKERKCSTKEAISLALASNKDLHEKYKNEVKLAAV